MCYSYVNYMKTEMISTLKYTYLHVLQHLLNIIIKKCSIHHTQCTNQDFLRPEICCYSNFCSNYKFIDTIRVCWRLVESLLMHKSYVIMFQYMSTRLIVS